MRRGFLPVLAMVAALVVVGSAILVLHRFAASTSIADGASGSAARRGPDESSPAAAAAGDSSAGDAARRESASESVDANHGNRVTGHVRFASDQRPAVGARVRAYAGSPPLAQLDVRRQIAASARHGKAAAEQSLDELAPTSSTSDAELPAAPAVPTPDEEDDATPRADSSGSAEATILREAVADRDGAFELTGLEPRTVHLDASLPAAVCSSARTIRFGDSLEQAGVELLLVPGGRVVGHVRGPDGAPIAAALVTLEQPFDPFSMMTSGFKIHRPAAARSDPSGAFAFDAVPAPLRFLLRATAPPLAPSAALTLFVAEGETATGELALTSAGALTVKVLGNEGQPIESASCALMPQRIELSELSSRGQNVPPTTKSDAEGIAKLQGIAPGRYRVTVSADGFVATSNDVDEIRPGGALDMVVRLDRGVDLRGCVRASDGTPIEKAHVKAGVEPSLLNLATFSLGSREAETGADGTFALAALPAGKLRLEAKAAGYDVTSMPVEGGGAPVDVVLRTRGALEGIVISKKTGKPLLRYVLRVARKRELNAMFSPSAAQSLIDQTVAIATPNGKFRLTGVSPGSLKLAVKAAEHAETGSDWIELGAGETQRGLIFTLAAESVIEGVVVEAATRKPVSGAEVRADVGTQNPIEAAMSQLFDPSHGVKSDEQGRFRVDGLAAGSHGLVARAEGFVDGVASGLEVEDGQTLSDVKLELASGGEIWGSVLNRDGSPAAGATIFCQSPTIKMSSAHADKDGVYHVKGLEPGQYSVVRMPAGIDLGGNVMAEAMNSMETKTIRLKAGESLRVDFLGAQVGSASLVGVVSQAGAPAAGVTVTVVEQGEVGGAPTGGMKAATSDDDGRYEVKGLKPGPAFVQLRKAELADPASANAVLASVRLLAEGPTKLDFSIPCGAIAGRVVDAASGAPLEGVSVYAAPQKSIDGGNTLELAMRRLADARTDAEGSFTVRNLRDGRYRVNAGGAGLLASGPVSHAVVHRDDVDVVEGKTSDAGTLKLPKGGRIDGTVTDTQNQPLPSASVFLREPGSSDYLEQWTSSASDATGHFEYGGVPGGIWDVLVRAPGHAMALVPAVKVSEDAATTLRVALAGGTDVFAELGDVDITQLLSLDFEVDGPQGRIPLTLFGLGDLTSAMQRPFTPGVVPLGRFGPGEYHVHGSLAGRKFERTFKLNGEPELHVPISLP